LSVDILTVSGTPYERGLAHGKSKREEIDNYLQHFYSLVEKDKTARETIQHVRKFVPFVEDYSPSIQEELLGISEGAQRGYEEIIMLHLHEEIGCFVPHCTSFAVTAPGTVDNQVYTGQTWDIPVDLCINAHPFLLRSINEEGEASIAFTYAGVIAGAGLNSHGISLNWNSLPRLQFEIGVPTYVIIAEVLRQKTIGKALEAIFRAQRAGCFKFMVSDTDEIYAVEATPADAEIFYSHRFLGHANHYEGRHKDRQDLNKVCSERAASTIVRQNRMIRFLNENWGSINVEKCQGILRDHVNYPFSICRHPEEEANHITCGAWIVLPGKGEFYYSPGPPCENSFTRVNVID